MPMHGIQEGNERLREKKKKETKSRHRKCWYKIICGVHWENQNWNYVYI